MPGALRANCQCQNAGLALGDQTISSRTCPQGTVPREGRRADTRSQTAQAEAVGFPVLRRLRALFRIKFKIYVTDFCSGWRG